MGSIKQRVIVRDSKKLPKMPKIPKIQNLVSILGLNNISLKDIANAKSKKNK